MCGFDDVLSEQLNPELLNIDGLGKVVTIGESLQIYVSVLVFGHSSGSFDPGAAGLTSTPIDSRAISSWR